MITNNNIVNHANPHTIKKFELIEKYVEAWAYKLLQNSYCQELAFIDCMSNSGEYVDDNHNTVFGTPVRVARLLRRIAYQFPGKRIDLYFSDLNVDKIEHLKNLMPKQGRNFYIYIDAEDGNELVKRLGVTMLNKKHCLLVYDPYDADINWNVIIPFINNWSEIIINHMVSDSMRAIKMAKKDEVINKYEHTYRMNIRDLIPYGSDKKAYEKRIEEIIKTLRHDSHYPYYIAAFPFFNGKNALVYNLIHCTSNINGFKLYKKVAWQTFGGKSSTKNTHGLENQLVLDFNGIDDTKNHIDEYCYYIKDIAEYLQKTFNGRNNVPLRDVWAFLDNHPVFPSEGFRKQIKKELEQYYGASLNRRTINFARKTVLDDKE